MIFQSTVYDLNQLKKNCRSRLWNRLNACLDRFPFVFPPVYYLQHTGPQALFVYRDLLCNDMFSATSGCMTYWWEGGQTENNRFFFNQFFSHLNLFLYYSHFDRDRGPQPAPPPLTPVQPIDYVCI